MAVDRQVLLRYSILNRCLRNQYKNYSIDDLVIECNKILYDTYGIKVSKRTIQEDLKNLQLPPYNIELAKNNFFGHKKLYRYKDTNFNLPFLQVNSEQHEALQKTLTLIDDLDNIVPQNEWIKITLKMIQDGMAANLSSNFISFQNNPFLSGMEHFELLLGAITNKQTIKIRYTTFQGKTDEIILSPYHLKQYNNRWFLIGKGEKYDNLSTYALDRIDSVQLDTSPYIETNIDFAEFFDDIIGITKTKGSVIEDVIISIKNKRFPYIATKPLHATQRILKNLSDETQTVIEIKVIINNELESLLLSFGSDMNIIKPIWLRNKLACKIKEMLESYSNDAENLQC